MTCLRTPPLATRVKKKQVKGKKKASRKPVTDAAFVIEELEGEDDDELIVEEEKGTGSHPAKNYTKIALYDKWVRSRNEATDNRNELEALQKEVRRDKKEISRLIKELDGKSEQVVNLQEKLEKKRMEINELECGKKCEKW